MKRNRSQDKMGTEHQEKSESTPNSRRQEDVRAGDNEMKPSRPLDTRSAKRREEPESTSKSRRKNEQQSQPDNKPSKKQKKRDQGEGGESGTYGESLAKLGALKKGGKMRAGWVELAH